jgi:thiosulfate/3-mercaptopyruvate sulfurtransferase
VLLGGLVLFLSGPGQAGAPPDGTITTEELVARLGQVVVLDTRSRTAFERAHIPGSQSVRWEALDPTRRTPAELAGDLGALGLTESAEVVVVGGPLEDWGAEGRMVWLLDWLGQARVSLLDGGFLAWQREGRAVEHGPSSPRAPARYRVRLRPSRRVGAAEVLALRGQADVVLLDVRSAAEFTGRFAYDAPRKGRLPGARHLDWTAFLRPDGHLDRSPALRERLRALGITPGTRVIVYCHSGVRAGLAVVALGALGHRRVLHYDASFADWSQRGLPLER